MRAIKQYSSDKPTFLGRDAIYRVSTVQFVFKKVLTELY